MSPKRTFNNINHNFTVHESTDFPVLFCATTYCTRRNVIMLYSTVLYLSSGIRSVLFYSKIGYTLKEDVGGRLE